MTQLALSRLANVCPPWFEFKELQGGWAMGVARPTSTPWELAGIKLHLEGSEEVRVRELEPGTCLPARCPERHIQGDRTFCVGLHRQTIQSSDEANAWWDHLSQYLMCQAIAERTGVWPPANALDHGDAGEYHERALAIAEQLGITEEYLAARLDEPSWITDPDLRLMDRQQSPINGRAPCPRECTSTQGKRKAIIRRKCKSRDLMLELVRCERKRRDALKEYWKYVRQSGTVCCCTMKQCELQDLPTARSSE